MKRAVHVTLALWVAAVGAALAQRPELQAPIGLQGTGPFHRLTLPSAIYSHAAFQDLSDVRVHNAAGQAVPFAWLDSAADAPAPTTVSLQVPIFAVPPASVAQADATSLLALRPDGTLGWAQRPATPRPAGVAMQWVIDAHQLDAALVQARFELAPGTQGVFPFTLEGSDDLRQWRPLGADDQLVRLHHGDQAVERLAIQIDQARAPYLRLRWLDPARAPALAAVRLDGVKGEAAPVAAIDWSAPVRASRCGADFCDYAVPRHLPIQSLRITLAEPNTLYPLHVFSLQPPATTPARAPRNALYVLRHGAAGRTSAAASAASQQERWLGDAVVYRLQQPGGEVQADSVPMDGGVHTTLRLRSQGPRGGLQASPPVVSFGSRPRALVFLEQGSAPFTLRWSASGHVAEANPAQPLPATTLIPGYRSDQLLVAGGASVALPPLPATQEAVALAPAVPAPPPPARKLWLWAALGAGLLLLAAMAWSLLRHLSKQTSAAPH